MRHEIEIGYSMYTPHEHGYQRTGDLLNTPQLVVANRNEIITQFEDNGNWESEYGETKGEHFFALHGWEYGTTWCRYGYQPYEMALSRIPYEVEPKYIDTLRRLGVPIA